METDVIRIVNMDYDEDSDSIEIEIPIPNAIKDSIDLVVFRDWFAIHALREDKEEADYMGEFNLCCPVDQDNVRAAYVDSVLHILFPLDNRSSVPNRVTIE